MECKFFHTLEGNAGFAVMTHNFQFFVVGDSDRSRDELRVKKLADLPGIRDKIVLTRTIADVFIQYQAHNLFCWTILYVCVERLIFKLNVLHHLLRVCPLGNRMRTALAKFWPQISMTSWYCRITFTCITLCVCIIQMTWVPIMLYSAAAVKPSCWSVLPQGSQFNVLAAVEDKLYILDPFEAVQQASICKGFRM